MYRVLGVIQSVEGSPLTSAPILAYSNNRDPFAPNTDATHLEVDAVLSQVKDGKSESWGATVKLLFDRSVTTALPDKSFWRS